DLAEALMDEPERIPIDLGYEQASTEQGASLPAGVVVQREDGTLVINILAPQPCAPSSRGEIVVCAPVAESFRYPAEGERAPEPNLMEALGKALSTKIGPVEIGPTNGGIQARV